MNDDVELDIIIDALKTENIEEICDLIIDGIDDCVLFYIPCKNYKLKEFLENKNRCEKNDSNCKECFKDLFKIFRRLK